MELVGSKEPSSNGQHVHEATDGEVWEAGDSGSDDGLTQQTVPYNLPMAGFYSECCLRCMHYTAHMGQLPMPLCHVQEHVLLQTRGIPRSDDPQYLQDIMQEPPSDSSHAAGHGSSAYTNSASRGS